MSSSQKLQTEVVWSGILSERLLNQEWKQGMLLQDNNHWLGHVMHLYFLFIKEWRAVFLNLIAAAVNVMNICETTLFQLSLVLKQL